MKVIQTPVPTKIITISGIEPKGRSALGKFSMNSKLPGNDHTKLKRVSVSNLKMTRAINITMKIKEKKIIPAVVFFMYLVDMF